jgi:DinB superfamily
MQTDRQLRQHLVKLLKGGDAHADFDTAIGKFPASLRGTRPEHAEHSAWEVLEHLRIAQWDILEFSRNPHHKSPEFPAGYWPSSQTPPDAGAWDKSAEAFRRDLRAFCDMVNDESTDLFARIPHGEGQTVLREVLVAADHNSYHLGELVLLRRILGAWE